jgi:hypothetical protein
MQFNRRDSYLRHQKNQHRNSTFEHDTIPIILKESPNRTTSNNQIGGGGENKNENVECISEEEAINGNLKVYHYPAQDKTKFDPLSFLRSKFDDVKKTLKVALQKRQSTKWYLTMQVRFTKEKKDATETVEPHFHGKCHVALKMEDVDKQQENYDFIFRVPKRRKQLDT